MSVYEQVVFEFGQFMYGGNVIGIDLKDFWRRLPFEFVVVFFSVYLAFLLTDYREQQVETRAKITYLETFKADLLRLDREWRQPQAELVDSIINFYTREIEAGHRPPLQIYRSLDFTINMYIIQSAFDPQHFETLTQEHLVSINMGSNLITRLQKWTDAFHAQCRRLLEGPEVDQASFYDRNGRLVPGMQWYLDDLKHIKRLLNQLKFAIQMGAVPATEALIKETRGDQP